MKKERIQKVLSSLGVGSRRFIEECIKEGRIKVNGEMAILGKQITSRDEVLFDGKKIILRKFEEPTRIIAYNKKLGEVTTRKDPEGRPTIFKTLPKIKQGRWVSVGRLDINTSGLILLTNNGFLANKMMHPSSKIEREYVARIHGSVTSKKIQNMLGGIEFEEGIFRFSDIQAGRSGNSNQWFAMVILEGKNREVRRIWESQGLEVSRLKRVRYGSYFLSSDIKPGYTKELSKSEIKLFEHL